MPINLHVKICQYTFKLISYILYTFLKPFVDIILLSIVNVTKAHNYNYTILFL